MRLSTLLTVALLGLPAAASAQTFNSPGEYNNFIVAEQRAMLKKNLRYISKQAHSDNEKRIDAKRLELVKQTELSLNKLAKTPAYGDDKGFKEQTTEAFYQLLKVHSEDYKAVDMLAATPRPPSRTWSSTSPCRKWPSASSRLSTIRWTRPSSALPGATS